LGGDQDPSAGEDNGRMTDAALADVTAAVLPPDARAAADAALRQASLAKPPGALGVLEDASVRLAGIQRSCPTRPLDRPALGVFAGDHGVHAQGVTAWPQEVTATMVENFRAGGAAVNVLARQVGAEVYVVDVGVAVPVPADDHVWDRKVRAGTADLSAGPAMTRGEALAGLLAGVGVARELVARGHDCLLTGDMGIANTTASAALVAGFTGVDVAEVTGSGAGGGDRVVGRKVEVIRAALADRPVTADPVETLASVGGLEHAGLAGFIVGGAAAGVPVVLDGVIAGAAALVAQALCPTAIDYCFAGHVSAEPGHRVALRALGLRPLVDLDLRLGEGSGSVLGFPLVKAAGAILGEMATFDSAGVARK
jgi:nicotinate-nucleotide--dimethylbenzimidazole phosphoribosyltransferase